MKYKNFLRKRYILKLNCKIVKKKEEKKEVRKRKGFLK